MSGTLFILVHITRFLGYALPYYQHNNKINPLYQSQNTFYQTLFTTKQQSFQIVCLSRQYILSDNIHRKCAISKSFLYHHSQKFLKRHPLLLDLLSWFSLRFLHFAYITHNEKIINPFHSSLLFNIHPRLHIPHISHLLQQFSCKCFTRFLSLLQHPAPQTITPRTHRRLNFIGEYNRITINYNSLYTIKSLSPLKRFITTIKLFLLPLSYRHSDSFPHTDRF
jgi:hypothetical protein